MNEVSNTQARMEITYHRGDIELAPVCRGNAMLPVPKPASKREARLACRKGTSVILETQGQTLRVWPIA